ncbi:MAG: HAMP domain-containing sensor histidine kinase [Nitrosarchaeum sp.]|uniref:sensor histidine kinase n=1 Tax=Nitrosarchaeum sp. TaxID=2026886 RepID=UPI002DEAEFAC|nr:HAMP domain-containing sensor histidine kinase [Nitrosarchaeum sp.]
MNTIMEQKSLSILKILIIGIIAVSFLHLIQYILDDDQFTLVSVANFAILPGILIIVSTYVTIKEWKNKTKQKISMVVFTAGAICWFIAEQTWTVLELVFEQEPFPSIADMFYLLAYPFFIVFFISYLKSKNLRITKYTFLFSIIISLVFLIPSLYVLVGYYEGEPTFDVTVGLLYTILSSILLFLILLGIPLFVKTDNSYFWTMIFIGFLLDTIADTLFLFTAIDDSYYNGHITDLLYLIGYLFFIVGFVFYLKVKSYTLRSEISMITFDTISKLAVPLVIGTIFSITSISLIYSYNYEQETSKEILFGFMIVGIFTVITVFSVVILILNKNINRFLRLKTKEIQLQKHDLEILLEEKSEEVLKSSEFSNIGINLSQTLHDLKNPLTVLSVNLDLLENSGIENAVLSSRIKSMRESINLMKDQMNDVLNYIKNPTITVIETDLLNVIEKAINNIEIPETVSVKILAKNISIQCDPTRMTLVFINILTNAIDAMENKGTITINVKQNNSKTIINIENSGPEIPQDSMEKLFEPLFTTKSNGTGLGLVTCQKIIKQHNGNITVKNNPTSFIIELPRKVIID